TLYDKYIHTHNKKYCKKCLSSYIVDITNNNNGTVNLENSKHEINNDEHSNCYLISGYIESTLTRKSVPILYLSWWNNNELYINLSMIIIKVFNLNHSWISHSHAIGGFGVIYKATWLDGPLVKIPHDGNNYRQKNQTVIVKRFEDSQSISKSFLNEVLYP